jgi:GNAT superfamily N-acetyltransferase
VTGADRVAADAGGPNPDRTLTGAAELVVRPVAEEERSRLVEIVEREWGSTQLLSRGEAHDLSQAPALFCVEGERVVGLATYTVSGDSCELLTIDAFEKQRGIGSRLLEAVVRQAVFAGCRRLWLITTNDNLDAIRFYQRRGLRLVAVHPGAVDRAREVKPQIPLIGNYGIRIQDELEFELELSS